MTDGVDIKPAGVSHPKRGPRCGLLIGICSDIIEPPNVLGSGDPRRCESETSSGIVAVQGVHLIENLATSAVGNRNEGQDNGISSGTYGM